MSIDIRNSVYVDNFSPRIAYLLLSMKEGTDTHRLKAFVRRMNTMSSYFTISYQRLHKDAKYLYLLVDVRSLHNGVDWYGAFIDRVVDAWEAEKFSVPFSEADKQLMMSRG